MARFFGLLKGKSLETQSEREELSRAWDNIWGIDQMHD